MVIDIYMLLFERVGLEGVTEVKEKNMQGVLIVWKSMADKLFFFFPKLDMKIFFYFNTPVLH
jgi:hypothetical protein